MTKAQWLFSFKGRIGREQYWKRILMLVVISLLIGFTAAMSLYTLDSETKSSLMFSILSKVIIVTIAIFIYWVWLAAIARRLHDINLSGWFSLLFLAPDLLSLFSASLGDIAYFISFIATIVLGIKHGTLGTNKYGEYPQGK